MVNHISSKKGTDMAKGQQEPAQDASCKAWVGAGREPLFHIDSVNVRTGKRARMTSHPMPEAPCETMCGKITAYPWRRLELVPAHS